MTMSNAVNEVIDAMLADGEIDDATVAHYRTKYAGLPDGDAGLAILERMIRLSELQAKRAEAEGMIMKMFLRAGRCLGLSDSEPNLTLKDVFDMIATSGNLEAMRILDEATPIIVEAEQVDRDIEHVRAELGRDKHLS